MLNRLLIQPKGFIRQAIPDFAREPADRIASGFEAFGQTDTVSESRSIPKNKLGIIRRSYKT